MGVDLVDLQRRTLAWLVVASDADLVPFRGVTFQRRVVFAVPVPFRVPLVLEVVVPTLGVPVAARVMPGDVVASGRVPAVTGDLAALRDVTPGVPAYRVPGLAVDNPAVRLRLRAPGRDLAARRGPSPAGHRARP
jgi:hypothetical protein